ncbi:cytochrome b5 [Coniosporium apollinis CBS 100218]|uniref:Cytochrome b5 n=1 Tax=Coniosporium apollinis (strain CBS 100218) TaxID=1168221 RepID=R7Z598_CONA1|nr:cytochrome b5 [Coniosporium apollinis CBS 100218]EON69283.1 cytochrome b5 [Coniosporium apollinis CBS 100218]
MADKDYTYSDVSSHSTKKDLLVVIHDKVYNASSFVDEHPGGEEVLLDVGGQDATEAFEDVGHSDEAREILEGLLVGKLKREDGDPAPSSSAQPTATKTAGPDAAGLGVGIYAIILVGGALAFAAYKYLQAKSDSSVKL